MKELIIKNAIQCKHCGDIIESKSVHDYVSCSCETVAVDGGKEYLKRSFKNSPSKDFEELSKSIPILPCPICGNHVFIGHDMISCEYCDLEFHGSMTKMTREELVREWNERKPIKDVIEKIHTHEEKLLDAEKRMRRQGKEVDVELALRRSDLLEIAKDLKKIATIMKLTTKKEGKNNE